MYTECPWSRNAFNIVVHGKRWRCKECLNYELINVLTAFLTKQTDLQTPLNRWNLIQLNSIFIYPFMVFWKAVKICWDISGSNVGYYNAYCFLDCNDVLFAVRVPTPSKRLLTCLLKKETADSCETLANFKHLRRKHIPASLHFIQTCAISYFTLFRSSDDRLSRWSSPLKLVTSSFFSAASSARFRIIAPTTPAAGFWRQLSSYAVRHEPKAQLQNRTAGYLSVLRTLLKPCLAWMTLPRK